MDIVELIRKNITEFCNEFISHPYLCYTEHGQHALFYTALFTALPAESRYTTWEKQKTCIIQKEYPTATNLGKPQRQHWDIAILSVPPKSKVAREETYDYLELLAAIEFGMNETEHHLNDDIERLTHPDANIVHAFIVHLYRLSDPLKKYSGRDWSHNSTRILTPQQVSNLSQGKSVEIYYGMADSTRTYEIGVWHIKSGKMVKIK